MHRCSTSTAGSASGASETASYGSLVAPRAEASEPSIPGRSWAPLVRLTRRPLPRPSTTAAESHWAGRVALWDRSGRRLLERDGTDVLVGPGDRRALIGSFVNGHYALVDTQSGRELSSFFGDAFTLAQFNEDGSLVAWDGLGMVDAATGKVLWKAAHFGPFIDRASRISVIRGAVWSLNNINLCGPLDVREGRTGAVLASFEHDACLDGQSEDGSLLLTRDRADVLRVRNAATFKEIWKTRGSGSAVLSADGRFIFHPDNLGLVVHRIADGAMLRQVPPDRAGERGLSFTSDGRYDGGASALKLLRVRVGSPAGGKLVPASEIRPSSHRPGLAADFFAGKDR
jgi:hypothetical protein